MSDVLSNDMTLPALRQDLTLLKGPTDSEGVPSWNIYDSIRNRYFKIGWSAFQLLSRWSEASSNKLLDKVNSETTCKLTNKDIDDLLVFLYANSLTVSSSSGTTRDYLDQFNSTKQHWLVWLIKNYLFFRIPLVKPHGFLKSTAPYVEVLFTSAFRNIVILLGVLGLYSVSRQWETFVNSFLYFFDIKGIAAYIAGLVFIKILHELGHAYTSTRYSAKVSTMGLAVLVLFPVLYTDTSNAWRLTSRKQRLNIGFAGMVVEIYIACLATFAWALLPDGIWRSIAFVLATSSWVLSLSINLNIFMRFDGYYILSDWWGVENLQRKSFSLGKWKLAEVLFGLNRPVPENVSRATRKKLIAYAWGTWIYRFFLFIAIALLVYHLFFKLLGIVLFIIEIAYFIVWPMLKQFKIWWDCRAEIKQSSRAYVTLFILFLILLLLFIPWNTNITVPAIFEATENVEVYAPVAAKIQTIHIKQGQFVESGELIAVLDSGQLNAELIKAKNKINNIQLLLNRHAASAENLSNLHVLLSRLEEAKSEVNSLEDQIALLNIYSPISGVITDVEDSVHESRWINDSVPMFNIINQQQHIIGLISETDIARVEVADHAIFYPDNAQIPSLAANINDLENINIRSIQQPYFNSLFGGEVAVRQDQNGDYIPESGVYRITFTPEQNQYNFDYVVTGQVKIQGDAKSVISRFANLVYKIFIQESGF